MQRFLCVPHAFFWNELNAWRTRHPRTSPIRPLLSADAGRARDAADVTDREAASCWMARRETYLNERVVRLEKNNALDFGVGSLDGVGWFCERGVGASPVARSRSCQSRCSCLGSAFGFCLRAVRAGHAIPADARRWFRRTLSRSVAGLRTRRATAVYRQCEARRLASVADVDHRDVVGIDPLPALDVIEDLGAWRVGHQ